MHEHFLKEKSLFWKKNHSNHTFYPSCKVSVFIFIFIKWKTCPWNYKGDNVSYRQEIGAKRLGTDRKMGWALRHGKVRQIHSCNQMVKSKNNSSKNDFKMTYEIMTKMTWLKLRLEKWDKKITPKYMHIILEKPSIFCKQILISLIQFFKMIHFS